MAWRIGIDVGGTFTDFVLAGGPGTPATWKEPSDPADPAGPVLRGIPALLARAGVAPDRVGGVVHGATLALNAVIQRGARVRGWWSARGSETS